MRHVHVNGVDLEYVDEGTGVPVVFSHGGSSDIRYWEPQREFFASRYRFIGYSHRYHLVGFSTAIALRAAVRAADNIRSLTIIEPNVPWLLEGDPEGEAVLAWWRAESQRVRTEADGDAVRRAELWFELVLERTARTISRSRVVILSGATHFMSYQLPDRFNQEVLDFLNRH